MALRYKESMHTTQTTGNGVGQCSAGCDTLRFYTPEGDHRPRLEYTHDGDSLPDIVILQWSWSIPTEADMEHFAAIVRARPCKPWRFHANSEPLPDNAIAAFNAAIARA